MLKEQAISLLTQVKEIILGSESWLDSTHQPIEEAFSMAIEALKQSMQTNVPNVLNALDCISRQAAIDAPEKYLKDCNPEHFIGQPKFIDYMDDENIGSFGLWQFANGFNMGLTAVEVAIKALPSAQPENLQPTCNNLATDCISRQAVLDYIDNMPSELTADGRRMIRRIRLTEYIQDSLPSVQPEVIRCKECEWFRKEYGWNCIEYTVCGVSPTHHPIRREDDFCSLAERRTDE